ncbi:MAG: hypothetical protein H8D23_38765 [Candidatus Brocadiales bacterium]|nr:hypothetical protein [Candidatus Brocadiales bacterium]
MAKRGKNLSVVLTESDKDKLKEILKAKKMSGRVFQRARGLLLINQSLKIGFVAQAVGVSRKTINNIGTRYLAKGLDYAL